MDIYACKLNLKVLSKEVILEDIMNIFKVSTLQWLSMEGIIQVIFLGVGGGVVSTQTRTTPA